MKKNARPPSVQMKSVKEMYIKNDLLIIVECKFKPLLYFISSNFSMVLDHYWVSIDITLIEPFLIILLRITFYKLVNNLKFQIRVLMGNGLQLMGDTSCFQEQEYHFYFLTHASQIVT